MSPITMPVSLVCLLIVGCFTARTGRNHGGNRIATSNSRQSVRSVSNGSHRLGAATNISRRLGLPRPVMELSEKDQSSLHGIRGADFAYVSITCGWRPEYDENDDHLRMPYGDQSDSLDEWAPFQMHFLQYIGHGVEGDVWLAEEARGEQGLTVALKVFRDGRSSYEQSRDTCEQHNKLADSKIGGKYPAVPRCFTFCRVIQPSGKETSAIGMEYIPGITAEPFFAIESNDTNTQSEDESIARVAVWPTAAANLLNNVAAMTRLGLGIPDMLEDNVRITADGEAYLVDLGGVTAYPQLEDSATREQLQRAEEECDFLFGMFMAGTLGYMSEAAISGLDGGRLMEAIKMRLQTLRSTNSFMVHLNKRSTVDLFNLESGKRFRHDLELPDIEAASWTSAVRSLVTSW